MKLHKKVFIDKVFLKVLKKRLVLLATLGEHRAWREIQNLYMRFVDPKSEVSARTVCTVSRGPLLRYVIACLPRSWD